MNDIKKQVFRPSVGLSVFERLGTKLYSRIESAIGETLSNSYDANAENTWIYYDRSTSNSKFMAIVDDGDGMTAKEMASDFMKIAYSDPKKKPRINGRTKMGSKGIGKLAPLFYSVYYDIYSKTSEGITGIRFSNNVNETDIDADGKSIFLSKDYENLPNKHRFLDKLETGTMILPGKITKNIPFSTEKIKVFKLWISTMFCFPPDAKFSIKLVDLNNKADISENIVGSYLKPRFSQKIHKDVFCVRSTNEIDTEHFSSKGINVKTIDKPKDISCYFMIQDSIKGLSNDMRPMIKVYSRGKLVMNGLPQQYSGSRTIGANYVSGVVVMDSLLDPEKNDVTSDNRETILNLGDDNDERVESLYGFIKEQINVGIKIYQENSSAKKELAKNKEADLAKVSVSNIVDGIKKILDGKEEEILEIKKLFEENNIPSVDFGSPTLIISHSSKNGEYANLLLNFLIYLGVNKDGKIDILNTSHRKYSLNYNDNFLDRLRDIISVPRKTVVVFCLSKDFFLGYYPIFEAGATFTSSGTEKKVHQMYVGNDSGLSALKPPFNSSITMPNIVNIEDAIKTYNMETISIDVMDKMDFKYFFQMVLNILVDLEIKDFEKFNEGIIRESFLTFVKENAENIWSGSLDLSNTATTDEK